MNVRICTLIQARLLTQHASVPVPSWRNFIISIIYRHSYAHMLRSSSHTCNAERYFSLFQFQELSLRVNVKQHGRFATDDYACLHRSLSSIPAGHRAQMRPSWSQERSRNASLWQHSSLKHPCTIHADLLLFSISPLVASMQPLHGPSDQRKVRGPLTGGSSHPEPSINSLKHL